MSVKDIISQLVLHDKDGNVIAQPSNLGFKYASRARTAYRWNTGTVTGPQVEAFPLKNTYLLADDDTGFGHGSFCYGASPVYPSISTAMSSVDYAHFRQYGTVATIAAGSVPRVIGCILSINNESTANSEFGRGDGVISQVDLPIDYTQIGANIWQHPMHTFAAATFSTTTGLSYITYTDGSLWDQTYVSPTALGLVRIESGADAGYYFVQYHDYTNNRLYLRCLNGMAFSALATASGLVASVGPGRRAYFNETGIIQLSVGTLSTAGRYNPRKDDPYLRGSFIFRITFDKSGSTEVAAGTEQQGSYRFSIVPWEYGDGIYNGTTGDHGHFISAAPIYPGINVSPGWFQFFGGSVNGMCLDWPNQRCWFGYTNTSLQSGIGFWRWKTTESFREIANYLGTAAQATFVTPTIALGAGDTIIDLEMGSSTGSAKNWCYITIGHASGGNAGVVIIKEDLTVLQYRLADGFPNSNMGASQIDSSRARVGTAGDFVSTAGAGGNCSSASGAFTTADVGRVIKITGATADNGTYLIATRASSTAITVTTLAGAGVTFTGGTGGTFEIGDRLYFFFNNTTTGAGKINYMESMAPGTFLTRTVTMTNGSNVNSRTAGTSGIKMGQKKCASVDPANGNIYWLSQDTQQQINKYDVAANTTSFLTIANIQSPAGGSPSNPATPTLFTAIRVNTKFDDIWVSSDQGIIKLQKSNFAGANYKRYYGLDTTTYTNPAGIPRGVASVASVAWGNTTYARSLFERADGRMMAVLDAPTTTVLDVVHYSQAADDWFISSTGPWNIINTDLPHFVSDPYGSLLWVHPGSNTGSAKWGFHHYEVDYQWDNANSKWIPLEFIDKSMPNKSVSDTTNTGGKSRPIHSTFQDLMFGVQVKFNRQGGATPPNNEFLGRGGQSRVTTSDGGTSVGTATFTGSGFSAGDVGKLLRLESGADANLYKITGFTNTSTITLTNMNGSAFSASATAGTLTYTVWDLGTPGSNAGPENVTFFVADGVAIDNVQDITGITYEHFNFKSRNYENAEGRKFCVDNPLAVPGSTATAVYFETYPVAAPQYDAATSHHRALPGAEYANGRQVLDGMVDKYLEGTVGKASMYSSPANLNVWSGNLASTTLGYSAMVDFGKDVEVGYIQIRTAQPSAPTSGTGLGYTLTNNGLIGNIYKATNAGGTPVASSVIRTSGSTNLTLTVNNTTISLGSGDFLGTAGTTGSNGVTVAGQSTFAAALSTFVSGDLMKVLKVTSGADTGSYRIILVSADGSTVTIRNLDQTAKTWTASASGIGYTVYDAVREEDMIATPALAGATHKLCVERLLSTTTAQVRTPPSATVSNTNWQCVKPSWDPVKRISYNTEAQPPEVANNGTWVASWGREQNVAGDGKIYADLTDLTSAQRTGRFWKFSALPRFTGNATNTSHYLSTIEFYDVTGNRLAVSKYTWTDQALQNTDFFYSYLNRIDFIQAANDGTSSIAGTNGLANLGGASGDTITLAGGNKFLGFQIGTLLSDGNLPIGTNTFNSASSSFPANAVVGRFLRIVSGANAGNYYRVASRVSATQLTVTTPSGGVVSWGANESGIQFTMHEGINFGGTYPDRFTFLSDLREYSILTINDALTTITISETLQTARTNGTWEIRRPGYDTSSVTTEATKWARLTRPMSTFPVQTGDVCHDSRGAHRFFAEDIGSGFQRTDGATTIATGTFGGSGFSPDDVGRLLYLQSGVDKGIYEISAYTNSTTITVKNHYTGAAVSFAASASTLTYQIFGDRRYRITKYVTGLRA